MNKPMKSHVEQKLDPAVDAIFDLWRTECDHPRAHLDQKRRRRIEWALATYPHDDIVDAIHGAAHSPFHQGDNDRHRKYDDLTLIFRDAEHLEQFRDMHRTGPTRRIPRGFGALLTTLAETWRHGEWTQDPRLIADTIRYIHDLEDQNRHLTGVHAELVRAEQLLERYEQKAAISRAGA